jgi:uncharacterized protein YjbI with pentapeptide repeats
MLERMENLHFLFCTMAKLPGVDFSGSVMERGRFDYADLSGARFHEVRAMRAEFWKAKLARADFRHANLRGACFHGADLRGARIVFCNLAEAGFRNTLVAGLDLAGSHGIGTAFVESIDIGSDSVPNILRGEDARAWMMEAAAQPAGSIIGKRR